MDNNTLEQEYSTYPMDKAYVAIKMNNFASTDPCGYCGGSAELSYGPELFFAHSFVAVCDVCAEEIVPELLRLKDIYWTIRGDAYDELSNPLDEFDYPDWLEAEALTHKKLAQLARCDYAEVRAEARERRKQMTSTDADSEPA